jgi:hypothetical protein
MPLLIVKLVATDDPDDNFSPVFSWLQNIGLGFRNPANNRITTIVAGKGQVDRNVEDVMRAVRNREPSNVQLWYPQGGDLFLGWGENEMTVFLAGKTIEQKRSIIGALVDNFLDHREGPVAEWKISIGIDDVI